MDPQHKIWLTWWQAIDDPAIDRDLRQLYAELDAAVAARGPQCWISGKCCKFDRYGHRLYVTGLEIAWFLRQIDRREGAQTWHRAVSAPEHDGCPWLVDGLCGAHDVRPLGCRVFFCQKGTEQWQQQTYERFLNALRTLHDTRRLPYHYMEWRHGLNEAAEALLKSHQDG